MVAYRLISTFCFALLLSVASLQLASADDGQPIAIRHWPGGGITVESMWDLSVGVGIDEATEKMLPKKLDFKLEDLKTQDAALIGREVNADKTIVAQGSQNKETGEISLKPMGTGSPKTRIMIVKNQGEKDKTTSSFSVGIEKNLLTIFNSVPSQSDLKADGKNNKLANAIDVSRINVDAVTCKKIADAMKPALMIVPRAITKVGEDKVEAVTHNTVAFSDREKSDKTRFVSLGEKPYEMSDDLQELFAKKEASCQASQKFFAELSVEQMNFKPDNGTHTPRWNPEHMMGRELLFFSQIYHAVDPMIPVMNLNPKQMPKDYKFAHPDWTGAEEARQMHRVEAFTRRFAYLLDGMALDKRAKGSRFWTPRKLLLQMVRHYSEHTANVKKKMELPGWPEK